MKITAEVRKMIRNFTNDREVRRLLILYVGDKGYIQHRLYGHNYEIAEKLVEKLNVGGYLMVLNPAEYAEARYESYTECEESYIECEWVATADDPEPPTVMEFDEWLEYNDELPKGLSTMLLKSEPGTDVRCYLAWLVNYYDPIGCLVAEVDTLEEFKDFLEVLNS